MVVMVEGWFVYFVGDKDMNTLQLFMGKQKFGATPGGDGTDNKNTEQITKI